MRIKNIFAVIISFTVLSLILYGGYLFYLNGKPYKYSGEVKVYKARSGKWEDLDADQRLDSGDKIKTEKSSGCSIILGMFADSVVNAGEGTEMVVVSKDPVELQLVSGELYSTLTRPSRLKGFTVKTPTGVCGIRGTGWQVSVADSGDTSIDVFEGRVKFGRTKSMLDNDPYVIRSGDKLEIKNKEYAEAFYKKLDSEGYAPWNEWVDDSRDKLTNLGVINRMEDGVHDPYPVWQEGICYASWRSEGYTNIESELSIRKAAKDTDASWISIISTWYQKDDTSTKIYRIPNKTPSDDSIRHILKTARRLGMHTMLSPFIDLEDVQNDMWRADIGFSDNGSWDAWFDSYEKVVMHYAELAESENVDIFNIGTELSRTTLQRPDKWVDLIKKIRKKYSGRLVYTANWVEEYQDITFWRQLDYAGISAYFPLSKDPDPSYREIKKNWQKWFKEIEAWQKTHGRPVIFPEIGYKSCEGSAKRPWGHDIEGPVDLKQQYNCYKAALETFWGKPWFYGMYWWVWRAVNPSMEGDFDKDYTPNDKPSSKLVKSWYAKPDPHK